MEPSKTSTQPSRILIIDDDIYTSEMYATTLRGVGYEVVVADNGLDGYQRMKSEPFDIVLLDIMLPQLQGGEVLKQWRTTRPKGSKPPIIILTNYEQDDATRETLVASADGYVIKASITPRKLREIIAKATSF